MKIGVIAGSFDPITYGHIGLIRQAFRLVDKLHVVVGYNPTKKYMFTDDERVDLTQAVLRDEFGEAYLKDFHVVLGKQELLVKYAESVGANYLIRGIRNIKDYQYEEEMEAINKDINPEIETLFFMPPRHLSQISSSTVKGLIGFEGGERTISKYVHPLVFDALSRKVKHA